MSTAHTKKLSRTSRESDPNRKVVGRIGPWQLVKRMREGCLTRLYIARPSEGPEVAQPQYVVKVLRKEWWRDPVAIETQRREAWVGRKGSHPHLLPVLAADVRQPPFYVVSPLLRGKSLAERLGSGTRLPLSTTLWIARQVAEALEALATVTGMIHADVKPDNIFVSDDGHATLIDCGFAQTLNEARSFARRPVVGTLHYMAPETITSALAADSRSDMYSLGATIYEMLCGRPPFDSPDPAEVAQLQRNCQPVCLLQRCPDIATSVASFVNTLLAKEPLRRPASLRELIDQLVRLEIECFGTL